VSLSLNQKFFALFGLVVGIYGIGLVLIISKSGAAPAPMRASGRLQLNECVELIGVRDPNTGEVYLVASDKCGHTGGD
jgi:hypothetical protein